MTFRLAGFVRKLNGIKRRARIGRRRSADELAQRTGALGVVAPLARRDRTGGAISRAFFAR